MAFAHLVAFIRLLRSCHQLNPLRLTLRNILTFGIGCQMLHFRCHGSPYCLSTVGADRAKASAKRVSPSRRYFLDTTIKPLNPTFTVVTSFVDVCIVRAITKVSDSRSEFCPYADDICVPARRRRRK